MFNLVIEGGNYFWAFVFVLTITLGVPSLLIIIGLILRTKKKKKASKVLFIIATIYLIICLGVCGSMM